MQRRRVLGGLGAGLAAGALAGCDTPARLASLPEKLRAKASFHGLPADARIVMDGSDDELLGRTAADALRREIAYAKRTDPRELDSADYLAISGGGENGAYGAGLLTAWTQLGTRPTFKAVTGVSTGALSAPFAFLGPEYDKDLTHFYTSITKKDVMIPRGLITAVLGDSMYDSTPLLQLIRSVITPDLVAAIAREYSEKGRLLCVATTNLDVPVGVLWNIGSIAASGNPQAPELIAKILLASASIPGAFPPVMIDMDVGGEHFQEMHVDGGTVAQVVFYPPSLSASDLLASSTVEGSRLRRVLTDRRRRLFVIRNSRPGADLETVDRSTLKIAGRAVSTLISTQGIGDLYRLYVLCQRDHIDYNVAYVPESFSERLREPFDQEYMRKLYEVGRETMLHGSPWSKFPPGYNPTPLSPQRSTAG
jgi:predicted acylesterase/phospholipase RssA